MTLTLRTKRLLLRAPVMGDAATVAQALGDYEVARYLTPLPFPYSEADAAAWLARIMPPIPERAVFGIDLAGRGLIGVVSIVDELGYWLAREFWGHGYLPEAARALLAWHFDNTDAQSVESGAHWNNPRSLAVLRGLGFTVTGSSRKFVRPQRREVEHIEMRLTRAAFEAAGGGRS